MQCINISLLTRNNHMYLAPLKLRPYGAMQICLLLLLFYSTVQTCINSVIFLATVNDTVYHIRQAIIIN